MTNCQKNVSYFLAGFLSAHFYIPNFCLYSGGLD